jgi:nucleotide-binding universal stress UspA family protein
MKRPLNRILVGFDDTDPARRALERAADLAERLGAQLIVIAVATPPLPAIGFDAALPGERPDELAAEGAYAVEHAERALDGARALLGGRTVRADYVSDLGTPAERILALAEERDADLIVVGTHHAGFLDRLFERSVSEAVSHDAQRDVLIVR